MTQSTTKSPETLIRKGFFRRPGPSNYRSNISLQVGIQLADFYLLESHIQGVDPRYIRFFRARDGKYEKTIALITCVLGQDTREFLDILYVERSVVFTAFAKLLLEVEYGDRFPANRQYLQAVAVCLHFESLYRNEHERLNAAGKLEDGFVTARRLIRHKIVSNLVGQNAGLTHVASSRKRSADEQEEADEGDLEHGSLPRVLPIRETNGVPNNLPGSPTKRTKRHDNRAGLAALLVHGPDPGHIRRSIDSNKSLSFEKDARDTVNDIRISTDGALLASKE